MILRMPKILFLDILILLRILGYRFQLSDNSFKKADLKSGKKSPKDGKTDGYYGTSEFGSL